MDVTYTSKPQEFPIDGAGFLLLYFVKSWSTKKFIELGQAFKITMHRKNVVFNEVFSEFACAGPKSGIFVNVYVIKLLCGLVIKKMKKQ